MRRMKRRNEIFIVIILIAAVIISLALYNSYAYLNQERLKELITKEISEINNYLRDNLTIIRTPSDIESIYLVELLKQNIQLIDNIDRIINGYSGNNEVIDRFSKVKATILSMDAAKLSQRDERMLINSIWELGYILGYIQAETNSISYNDIELQINQVRIKLSDTYVKYISKQKLQIDHNKASNITTLLMDHIFAVQTIIDGELYQANRLVNQTMELIHMEGRPYANKIGMAISTIKAIQTIILKINIIMNHYDNFYSSQSTSTIYNRLLLKLNTAELRDIPSESFANLTLQEANNYIKLAKDEAQYKLYTQAIIDLIIADILYKSMNNLRYIPDPFTKTVNVDISNIIEMKNRIIYNIEKIERDIKIDRLVLSKLLFYPISDIHFVQTLIERRIKVNMIDNEALTYLYAFYARAAVYLANLNKNFG